MPIYNKYIVTDKKNIIREVYLCHKKPYPRILLAYFIINILFVLPIIVINENVSFFNSIDPILPLQIYVMLIDLYYLFKFTYVNINIMCVVLYILELVHIG